MGVKGNQRTLKQAFEYLKSEAQPFDESVEYDRSHGRWVERVTQLYHPSERVVQQWPHARCMVVTERYGERDGRFFHRTSYHLSDIVLSAKATAAAIRGHRYIENDLHWVRDVVLGEDASPVVDTHAVLNWSCIRSFVLNTFRTRQHSSLTTAIRRFAHDIPALFSLLITN